MINTNEQLQIWAGKKKPETREDQQAKIKQQQLHQQQAISREQQQASDEIVFSDKHSLADYQIGSQIG